jgi:hypothetical protein
MAATILMASSNIVVVNVVVKTKPTLSAIRGDGEEPLGLKADANLTALSSLGDCRVPRGVAQFSSRLGSVRWNCPIRRRRSDHEVKT